MIFSYSRLKKHEECPWVFYKKYVLELPEEPTEAQEQGKAVHRVIQEVLTDPSATLADAAVRACAEAALPLDPEVIVELARHDAVKQVKDLALAVGHVEEHFELPLDGPGSPVTQGYIDLWWQDESGAYLIDWKTNRTIYNPRDNHQLGLYAWAIKEKTGCSKVKALLVFLRFKEIPLWEEYGEEEMEAARQWALQLAMDIESRLAELELFGGKPDELFPARPGDACRYCSFAGDCLKEAGAVKALEVPESIQTLEEAQALAGEIIRLETALSGMKGRLKEWVQVNGPVRVGDQEFRLVPAVNWNFSPEKLKEFCKMLSQAGINPWEVLTIGSSQLKKLKLPEEELARYGEKDETKTFRRVKVKSA
jgi:hypothetical protein